MAQAVSSVLLLIGALFMFLAALGVLRMPDVFMRMHSSTKSATLGVGCVLLGVALYFDNFTVAVRALAVIVFLFGTAPVAAHMLGRAAYFSGVPLWEGTLSDDLRGCYDSETHILASSSDALAKAAESGTPAP
jgi:multicomponent Na+:H+ antiporter subunit G